MWRVTRPHSGRMPSPTLSPTIPQFVLWCQQSTYFIGPLEASSNSIVFENIISQPLRAPSPRCMFSFSCCSVTRQQTMQQRGLCLPVRTEVIILSSSWFTHDGCCWQTSGEPYFRPHFRACPPIPAWLEREFRVARPCEKPLPTAPRVRDDASRSRELTEVPVLRAPTEIGAYFHG